MQAAVLAWFRFARRRSGAQVRRKLVVVNGDISQPGLGLSTADRRRLCREVNFVIHSAASISFVEPVHTLLAQNYVVRPLPTPCGHIELIEMHCALEQCRIACI